MKVNRRVIHAIKRAYQRYRLKLTVNDIFEIEKFILHYNLTFNATVAVPYLGQWLAVGYKINDGIMTFLPKEELNDKMKIRAKKVLQKLIGETKNAHQECG